jgi:hypothetical protein
VDPHPTKNFRRFRKKFPRPKKFDTLPLCKPREFFFGLPGHGTD